MEACLPEYVEVYDRLYEVVVVPGPLSDGGIHTFCIVEHDEQKIRLSDEVAPEQRGAMLEKAVSASMGLSVQLVPLRGRIQA